MSRFQVELLASLEHGCHRNFLRGVSLYVAKHPEWELHVSPYQISNSSILSNSGVDGIITYHSIEEKLRTIYKNTKLPLVYYGYHKRKVFFRNSVQVFPDEEKIGAMAAQHFLERGFQSFVYCYNSRWPSWRERGVGFKKEIAAHGLNCTQLEIEAIVRKNPMNAVNKVAYELGRLPRPLAIFSFNDILSAFVLRAIKQADMNFPGEAALLGVDNDELLCESQTPPLSSIDSNWHEMGYRAAEALDQLAHGKPPASGILQIAPKNVSTRTSTDFLAFPDRLMVDALCFIREKLHEGISVQDVLAHFLVSRPTLDSRFQHYLGHSVTEEISRTRLQRARLQLEKEDYTIERIAYECGYKYPDSLFRIFRRTVGCTPSEYRKKFQATE